MGYLGKFTLTPGRQKQRVYSIEAMENIENKRVAIAKTERQKVEQEINRQWLCFLIQELKEAFAKKQDVISHLESNVFSKWELHNFKRAAYLAPVDVYNALTDFSDDVKSKAEEIGENMRICYKKEVYKKD